MAKIVSQVVGEIDRASQHRFQKYSLVQPQTRELSSACFALKAHWLRSRWFALLEAVMKIGGDDSCK